MIIPKKILSLEAIRGLTALFVLLFHASAGIEQFFGQVAFKNFFYCGYKGVDLFFVLSGFIIFFVHHQDIDCPNRIWNYLWRRFSRIYPTYWAAFILILVAGKIDGRLFNPQSLLSFFFLLPHEVRNIVVVSWTLTFEIMFYFFFSFFILNRWTGSIFFISWTLSILVVHFQGIVVPFFWGSFFSTRNFEFFSGMLAARWLIYHPPKLTLSLAVASLSVFLGLAIGEVYVPAIKEFGLHLFLSPLIYGLSAALFILGLTAYEQSRQFNIPPFLLLLGAASYSIYLIHIPALVLFFRITRFLALQNYLNAEIHLILSGVFASIVGILFYQWIESPIRALIAKTTAKRLATS